MNLSDDDIQKISDAVACKIKSDGFNIDPEQHYNQHHELSELLSAVDQAKGGLIKGFLSLCAAGLLVFAAIGLKFGWTPK